MSDAARTTGGGARPLVLVTGATGAQGGSVARFLLASDRWAVRALTRRPDAPAARALAAAGADVVAGDLADADALQAALVGCDAAFGVTNFWEHFGAELAHGRQLLAAVAASGVRHFVFSTLPSAERASGGTLRVPHLDLKAQLEDEARAMGLPVTFVHVAFYYENFLSFFPPRRGADGGLAFGFPQGDRPLPAVAAADLGGVVLPILDDRAHWIGRTLPVVGDERPASTYAAALGRALGEPVAYQHVPADVYAGLGFPGAEELAAMFDYNRRFAPSTVDAVAACRALYPGLQDLDTWAVTHAEALSGAIARTDVPVEA